MNILDQQLFNNPDPQAVRSLLQRGANPNAQDKDGRTPLYYAGVSLYARSLGIAPDWEQIQRVAEELLAGGADPDLEDRYGTPAIQAYPDFMIDYLLKREAIRKGRARLDAELPRHQSIHHQEQRL